MKEPPGQGVAARRGGNTDAPYLERRSRAAAYENARPEIQRHVPASARRILDLGCSSGALGAALKAQVGGRHVGGVEIDPVYARQARDRLDFVIEADVESLREDPSLGDRIGLIDFLIAGDVLEHLRDPWNTLRVFASLLPAGGGAVVSLPNVRYWETFWQLGRHGIWPLRSEGIFDRTHLRWFTLANALDLLDEADLEVARIDPQYRLSPAGGRLDRHAAKLHRTPLRPFLAFQYVLLAHKR